MLEPSPSIKIVIQFDQRHGPENLDAGCDSSNWAFVPKTRERKINSQSPGETRSDMVRAERKRGDSGKRVTR
jgi:hypothetical protein